MRAGIGTWASRKLCAAVLPRGIRWDGPTFPRAARTALNFSRLFKVRRQSDRPGKPLIVSVRTHAVRLCQRAGILCSCVLGC